MELLPYLEKAEKRLSNLIAQAASEIEDKSLVRVHVKGSRIKDFQSVWRKVKNCGYSEEEDLYEINDLVGIRVVCNNIDDVYRFCELLKETYLERHLVTEQDFIDNPQSSGYRALHLNILVETGEPLRPRTIPCEIQIRTLIQDSWAELAHNDIYKSDINLPDDLRGRMEDLASVLSAADEIAQRVRRRIEREFKVPDSVDFDHVTPGGLAFVFKQVFGRPPSEYSVRQFSHEGERGGLRDLHKLEEILSNRPFRERMRESYMRESDFHHSLEPEIIFIAAIRATVQNEKAAISYVRRHAREEREKIDAYWRDEVLSLLPETLEEFMEGLASSDIEEIADAWGIAESCAICGTTIVDMDTFSHMVADHYKVDNPMSIFSDLFGVHASWSDGGLCSYHAYQAERDV